MARRSGTSVAARGTDIPPIHQRRQGTADRLAKHAREGSLRSRFDLDEINFLFYLFLFLFIRFTFSINYPSSARV